MKSSPHTVFDRIDGLDVPLKGWRLLAWTQPFPMRTAILAGATLALFSWIALGWDSCFDQLEIAVLALPRLLTGQTSMQTLQTMMAARYGIGTHFSAAVTYGLLFYFASVYFQKVSVKGSMNIAYSLAVTTLAISLFEFTWMTSYGLGQGQWWVLNPVGKQAGIIWQNTAFLVLGACFALFVAASPYKFQVNRRLGLLMAACAGAWMFWYFYPLPTVQLAAVLADGSTWISSATFPQTMYTVAMDPAQSVGFGLPYFVNDPLLHGVNLAIKTLWAYTVFYFAKIVRRKQ